MTDDELLALRHHISVLKKSVPTGAAEAYALKLLDEIDRLRAERDAMRAVVEAAKTWQSIFDGTPRDETLLLWRAVEAYRKANRINGGLPDIGPVVSEDEAAAIWKSLGDSDG